MTKVLAHLRVSGKGQVEGDGFTRQLKAVREYAAAHDMKIVNVYREEGVSGTKESADRPAWCELMTALHANGVRTVIIEKLDRLARYLMVQETIIADLCKNGFELVSAAEQIGSSGCCAEPPNCESPRIFGKCSSLPVPDWWYRSADRPDCGWVANHRSLQTPL